jgi:hypothetical protein
MTDNPAVPDGKWLYRVGGISALVLGIAYIIIFPLFAHVGAPPTGGGEAWLKYLSGRTTVWWAILGLSVLTDFLLIPVALSLYLALKRVNRDAMLLATALMWLFVVLDLQLPGQITRRSSFSAVYTMQPRTTCSGRPTSRLQIMPPQCWRPRRKFSTP